MTYTLEEAKILRDYYSKIIIGKYVDSEEKHKIQRIKIFPIPDNKTRFEVKAKTNYTRHSIAYALVTWNDVESVANKFGLPSPNKILNEIID